MRDERAILGASRGLGRVVKAIEALKTRQASCHKHRAERAVGVVNTTGDGEPRAVCAQCLQDAQLNRQIQRQREERARMARRAATRI
jgi:hypothetical protein